jgi:glycosyltransferase involved in cell wall biosynthesis
VAVSVSVVFPMYNEEGYIRRAVRAAEAALGELGDDWQIVIVDDASTDATAAIAAELARAEPRLELLRNERRRGLGGTLRRGLAAARCELVLYTDADLPCDLMQLGRAVRLLDYQEADVLAAYRFDRTGEGRLRAFYSWAYTALVRLLFALPVRDVNFAFKLFRRALLERLAPRSEGSFIDAELLVRARNAGAAIVQIGVDYFPRRRGLSTLSSPRVILGILSEMLAQWPELARGGRAGRAAGTPVRQDR